MTFPPRETAVVTPFVEVTFPPNVTAAYVPPDGLLALNVSAEPPPDEQVQRALAYGGSGRVVPQRIVDVGGSGAAGFGGAERITFDMPIRILLEGQAGGRAFYIQGADGTITPVDAACAADDVARVHRQLGGAGECQIDSGDRTDKIIYTYHLTRFGTVLSEHGTPPPTLHTCSADLGMPDLRADVRLGEYSPPVRQYLINSGSMPFAHVELVVSPWHVDPAVGSMQGAGFQSPPGAVTEIGTEGISGEYVALANGTAVAHELGGGDSAPLWFRLDLTSYDEVQGSALVQYIEYHAQCSR